MTDPIPSFLTVKSSLAAPKKKRVLLVDASRSKRDLRSETIRRLGAEVDCAADISEARSWWRPELYDLVLIEAEARKNEIDKFCDDLRRMAPGQQIRFLVGKPGYLAHTQAADPSPGGDKVEDEGNGYEAKVAAAGSEIKAPRQQWGILEACHRISAVRSALDARTRAIRDRPLPPRDSELRNHRTNGSDPLGELIRQEVMKETL